MSLFWWHRYRANDRSPIQNIRKNASNSWNCTHSFSMTPFSFTLHFLDHTSGKQNCLKWNAHPYKHSIFHMDTNSLPAKKCDTKKRLINLKFVCAKSSIRSNVEKTIKSGVFAQIFCWLYYRMGEIFPCLWFEFYTFAAPTLLIAHPVVPKISFR